MSALFSCVPETVACAFSTKHALFASLSSPRVAPSSCSTQTWGEFKHINIEIHIDYSFENAFRIFEPSRGIDQSRLMKSFLFKNSESLSPRRSR